MNTNKTTDHIINATNLSTPKTLSRKRIVPWWVYDMYGKYMILIYSPFGELAHKGVKRNKEMSSVATYSKVSK